MNLRALFCALAALGVLGVAGCDETSETSGAGGGGAGSGGGDTSEGGAGGVASSLPSACVGETPVAGGVCPDEDQTCDAVSATTSCERERFRCCNGRWRGKEACDGTEIRPNQANCDALF
jgi:hypothetical protein